MDGAIVLVLLGLCSVWWGWVNQAITTQWIFDEIGMSARCKEKLQEDGGC